MCGIPGIGGLMASAGELWKALPENIQYGIIVGGVVVTTTTVILKCLWPARPRLEADLLEIRFRSNIPVSVDNGDTPVTEPNWTPNVNSLRPGVLPISKSLKIRAQIRVTQSEGAVGVVTLKGTFKDFEFRCNIPSIVGVHTVYPVLQKDPTGLTHLAGDFAWSLTYAGGNVDLAATKLELFLTFGPHALLGDGTSCFKTGVWAELLRFLLRDLELSGQSDPMAAVREITRYCHANQFRYAGTGRYELDMVPSQGYPYKIFRLLDYLKGTIKRANCADQAYAVAAMSHALGVNVRLLQLDPFGYIQQTHLVGVGLCNNPSPDPNGENELGDIVEGYSPLRWGFFRHIFNFTGEGKKGKIVNVGFRYFAPWVLEKDALIFDACAGPCLGLPIGEYLEASIDVAAHQLSKKSKAKKLKEPRSPESCGRAEYIERFPMSNDVRPGCPQCGAGVEQHKLTKEYYRKDLNIDYRAFECAGCGATFEIGQTRV